jgi:hypothetical protein
MLGTKICAFAALEASFKAGRRLRRSHMGLSSKVDARAFRQTKAMDIARVCTATDSLSGSYMKGFSCTKGRRFGIDPDQRVDIL